MSTRARLLIAVAGLSVAYFLLLRERVMTWGSSREDARRRLVGDELLDNADDMHSTDRTGVDAADMGPAHG